MKRILSAVVLSFCLASQVLAQAGSTPPPATPPAPAPAPPPVAGTVVLGVSVTESVAVALGYRASKFIGAAVYNDQNKKVGKIGDLIIKPDGTVSYAIIDVGGFLGMGVHHVAVPVNQFKEVKPKIILPGATKDALKGLPEFHFAKS